jgi:sugar phosphate isomerase/epimerase
MLKAALSVRIVESPDKKSLFLSLEQLIEIAAGAGYGAICMRASGVGVQTPRDDVLRVRRLIEGAGMRVSMVTPDFDVPLNNDRGPQNLRDIALSVRLAEALGCDLIRVCLKQRADIAPARQAAREAAQAGVRLAHQCHTATLFEQIDPMLRVLDEIGEENFGIIYEPANLMLCGEPYGLEALSKLRPHIMNVYVQNHRLDSAGPVELDTYCLGKRRFQHLPLWEKGGVDFDAVFGGLNGIGYNGFVTIHQAEGIQSADAAREYATRCARFVHSG